MSLEEDMREMNSDGYEKQYMEVNYKFPKTSCNILMPEVKEPINSGRNHRICDTCCKEDVCIYKKECSKAVLDIADIMKRTNVFIDTEIHCDKWVGKVFTRRSVDIESGFIR